MPGNKFAKQQISIVFSSADLPGSLRKGNFYTCRKHKTLNTNPFNPIPLQPSPSGNLPIENIFLCAVIIICFFWHYLPFVQSTSWWINLINAICTLL